MTKNDCCINIERENRKKGLIWGAVYGIIPHTFCILFVLFSIIGATSGTVFLRKFLFVPHLYLILVLISFGFASLSAYFYLKKKANLNFKGIRSNWRYLLILFSTTITINLLLFYWVLPTAGKINSLPPSDNQEMVTIENGVQIIRMNQLGRGYQPNHFTVKKDVPVKWIIEAKSPNACSASILAPKIGVRQTLEPGQNEIDFTPTEIGEIKFSCLMGMYAGSISVIN